MNKKSIAEIKKQFKNGNPNFVINKIGNAYVSHDNIIKFENIRYFGGLPEVEAQIYMENAKKTLGGQIGKALNVYDFPKEAYDKGNAQDLLYNLLKSELSDKELFHDYISFIMDNIDYKSDYYITILHCTYSITDKDKNDEDLPDSSESIFNFLLISFNMISLSDIGLYYNEDASIIEKKTNTDYVVIGSPCDGFMFPTFSMNCADINNVLYFTKTPKNPNKSIIENVLNCKFTLSAIEEKEKFEYILGRTLENNIDYDTINSIHNKIRNIIKINENEEETPSLSKKELSNILKTSGIKENDIEAFNSYYDEELGEKTNLKAVNLVDANKVNISSPDVTVTVKANKSNNVEATVKNGKKCLIITLDENVEVNGIDVNITK